MENLKPHQRKGIHALLSLLSIIVSAFIIMYYWKIEDLYGLIQVPVQILILVVIFIFIQLGKRYITAKQNWWDWMYYIGLIAIAMPIFFAKDSSYNMFLIVAQIGVLFLPLPILIDAYFISKPKES